MSEPVTERTSRPAFGAPNTRTEPQASAAGARSFAAGNARRQSRQRGPRLIRGPLGAFINLVGTATAALGGYV
mgnify:CR=1 FL=1